jgi:CubicO group peptidase (beta-lactamase class C family)
MSTLPALGRILRRHAPPIRGLRSAARNGAHGRPPDGRLAHAGARAAVPVERNTGELPSDRARFEPAMRIVRDAVAERVVPTAVVGIRHGTSPAVVELMTRPGGDRLARDSIYFLASVTKPVTSLAVMLLIEDGAVELDRPLVLDLPEFAGADRAAVTPRHLLTHTGGIDDEATGSLTSSRPSARQLFDLACRMPLRFPPGTRFEYSSVSAFLLGELIARRSGMPYPAFVDERILRPLGMRETAFDPRPLGRDRLMAVHGAALDSWWKRRIALRYLASISHPGGGLWGTVDDLLRFGDAMLDAWHGRPGAIVRQATMREMTRLQTADTPALVDGVERPAHYGLGWWKPGQTAVSAASADAFEHGGASGTRLLVDPQHDLVVVYLSNAWRQSPDVACWPAIDEIYRALEPQATSRAAAAEADAEQPA